MQLLFEGGDYSRATSNPKIRHMYILGINVTLLILVSSIFHIKPTCRRKLKKTAVPA